MPSVRDVKEKFEEFLKTLSEAQEALGEQSRKFTASIQTLDEARDARFEAILSGLSENNIEMLDGALKRANADWSASDFIAEMHNHNRENYAQITAIEQEHGSFQTVGQKLDEGVADIMTLARKGGCAHLLREIEPSALKSRASKGIINLVQPAFEEEVNFRSLSVGGILNYNTQAHMNGQDPITSKNFGKYRESLLWHAWNKFSSDPGIKARAEASKLINAKLPNEVSNDLKRYEEVLVTYEKFKTRKQEVRDLQKIYDELRDLGEIISEGEMETRLREKITETLMSSKDFRVAFADEFGDAGKEIIATHSKSVLLGQLHSNIESQGRAVGKAIDDIKEGLGKMEYLASYRTVRVDLDKIEKSIEEGAYDIRIYTGQMDERRARVERFSPERTTTQNDDGMYFNYLMLYVVLSDSAGFDSGNHDMSRDLSSHFGDALPNLAALDIENYNMNTMFIPGIDIGASVDISSSLSDISSSMPSSSDYGGGYDGGGYDGGGYDGGGYSGGFDGGGGF